MPVKDSSPTLKESSPITLMTQDKALPVRLNLVVAVDLKMGIGKENKLPWRLKSELAYFARLTKTTQNFSKTNLVLMGRKTWESIPSRIRPLKSRLNMVLSSRDPASVTDNDSVEVVDSFPAAMERVEALKDDVETCWVIGGSSVYQAALESGRLDKVFMTRINKEFDCDTQFPEFGQDWVEVEDKRVPQEEQEEDGVTFHYKVYSKRE